MMPRCVNKIFTCRIIITQVYENFQVHHIGSRHCQRVAIEEQLSFFIVAFSKISKGMYKQSLL